MSHLCCSKGTRFCHLVTYAHDVPHIKTSAGHTYDTDLCRPNMNSTLMLHSRDEKSMKKRENLQTLGVSFSTNASHAIRGSLFVPPLSFFVLDFPRHFATTVLRILTFSSSLWSETAGARTKRKYQTKSPPPLFPRSEAEAPFHVTLLPPSPPFLFCLKAWAKKGFLLRPFLFFAREWNREKKVFSDKKTKKAENARVLNSFMPYKHSPFSFLFLSYFIFSRSPLLQMSACP